MVHDLAARPGRRDAHHRGLTEGAHSGDAGGVVPDSFRIARQLVSRIEDEDTGRIIPEVFHTEIPKAPTEAGRGDGDHPWRGYVPTVSLYAGDTADQH